MIKNFIFTLGLPGCGKSTYIDEHYKNAVLCPLHVERANTYYEFVADDANRHCVIVSADEYKKQLNGYTDNAPQKVHQESVDIAKNNVYWLSSTQYEFDTVIMDGGGINNHYTLGIIDYVRHNSPKCNMTCLFFDTPVDVCLKRIESRTRKVPIDSIYDKNSKLIACVHKISPLVENFIRVDYFTNKHVFFDMDGTIVRYGSSRADYEGNLDFVSSEMFKWAKPVTHVVDFLKSGVIPLENMYILTACPNSISMNEKLEWINKYLPFFKKENIYWVGNKDWKHVFLKQLANKNKWNIQDVTVVDDMHDNIRKCKNVGMNAVHVSNIESFLDDDAIFS